MMDTRKALDNLIHARGEDYSSVSRLLGRNAAYIQQFIHRGVPRKLDEDDRRKLAHYFNVDETMLGAPIAAKAMAQASFRNGWGTELIVIPRFAVDASAGPGGFNDGDPVSGEIAFDPIWLRKMKLRPQGLSMIQVQGDSMTPTLNAGDDILVDRDDTTDRLRDGIYVLRDEELLLVKRLAVNPLTRQFIIRSDNPVYPDWADADLSAINVIGRVVWVGRKVG